MNKTEIIDLAAEDAELSKSQAARVVNSILQSIANALKEGDQVVLAGFGTFSAPGRAARVGRNPNTGEPIDIPASRVAKFKAGKALKDAINNEVVEA